MYAAPLSARSAPRGADEEKTSYAYTQRIPQTARNASTTRSFASPRSNPFSIVDIRTSAPGGSGLAPRPSTQTDGAYARSYDVEDPDDDGIATASVLWGRSALPTSQDAFNTHFSVSTRGSQLREKRHRAQANASEPIRQIEEKIATLPMLRDAVAAEYAGTANPSAVRAASHSSASRHRTYHSQSISPPPIGPTSFSSPSQAFGRNLLKRHCGAAVVNELEDAHAEIGALRMELELLKRLNESLSNPGRSENSTFSSQIDTSMPFTEANFHLLYLENTKMRELLETTVQRYDAADLAVQQRTKDLHEERETTRRKEQELVALKTQRATLEQQVANLTFASGQSARALTQAQTMREAAQSELSQLQEKYRSLESEHQLCSAFKTVVEQEREDFRAEVEKSRQELRSVTMKKEAAEGAAAGLEGRLLVQMEVVRQARREVDAMKEQKQAITQANTVLEEELAAVRVALVQSDGSVSRLQRELSTSDSELARVSSELTKLKQSVAAKEDAQSGAYLSLLSSSESAISKVKAQLALEKERQLAEAQQQLAHLESMRREMRGLEVEHEGVKEENVTLRKQNDFLTTKAEELKAQIGLLEEQTGVLKEELRIAKESEEEAASRAAAAATSAAAAAPSHAHSHSSDDSDDSESSKPSAAPSARPSSSALAGASAKSAAEGESDVARYLSTIRELELRVREQSLAMESTRRIHEKCGSKLSKAELEAEREANLRRVQLKSAKEVRRRLESQVSVLEVKLATLQKSTPAK
jgi:hypothetical protein